ncbi:hypothetical protein PROFUN_02921 [Planoprotostelium fungivorum]|uniref:GH16 domain-containing protein n=1 Tax=Planoprotostelium fungivorum TaxID=1890364 RepID=A0A2P6NS19_9EUKA|nr:hypothetical protein PROFUN_02921 [Planoprotostelium fungivorum]
MSSTSASNFGPSSWSSSMKAALFLAVFFFFPTLSDTLLTPDDWTYWQKQSEWDWMTELGQGNQYYSSFQPGDSGSDWNEDHTSLTTLKSSVDFDSYYAIGYYTWGLQYNITGGGYIYASMYYRALRAAPATNTGTFGSFFSIFLKNTQAINGLIIQVKDSNNNKAHWTLNLPAQTPWSYYQFSKNDAALSSNSFSWSAVTMVNVVITPSTATVGSLSFALASFLSDANYNWTLSRLPYGSIMEGVDRIIDRQPLYEDFSSGKLDPSLWKVGESYTCHHPGSGGVVPDNVMIVNRALRGSDSRITSTTSAYNSSYYLRLEVHGNNYTGDVMGVFPNGSRRADVNGNKRVGAMITTNNYYASGSYQVRAKLTRFADPVSGGGGVVNAFWTFHYEEYGATDPNFKCMPVGCWYRRAMNADTYYARNHEIDIEIPGHNNPNGDGISFSKSLFNYWQGENGDSTGRAPYCLWNGTQWQPGTLCNCVDDASVEGWDQYKSNSIQHSRDLRYGGEVGPDGEDGWHVFRIDWHTANSSVMYWVDGVLLHNSTSDGLMKGPDNTSATTGFAYVPFIAGRFTIGAWFPYGNNPLRPTIPVHWAGEPLFDMDALLIDWVKITPYNETGEWTPRETYPDTGYAALNEYPITPPSSNPSQTGSSSSTTISSSKIITSAAPSTVSPFIGLVIVLNGDVSSISVSRIAQPPHLKPTQNMTEFLNQWKPPVATAFSVSNTDVEITSKQTKRQSSLTLSATVRGSFTLEQTNSAMSNLKNVTVNNMLVAEVQAASYNQYAGSDVTTAASSDVSSSSVNPAAIAVPIVVAAVVTTVVVITVIIVRQRKRRATIDPQ